MSDANGQPHVEGLSRALRWAMDTATDPALASADWLAADIGGEGETASGLLTNPQVPLVQLRQAKSAFKTMRIVGETSADRRVGARLYAATIAAALVRHDCRISSQSDEAVQRGLSGLAAETSLPESLRALAGLAICHLGQRGRPPAT